MRRAPWSPRRSGTRSRTRLMRLTQERNSDHGEEFRAGSSPRVVWFGRRRGASQATGCGSVVVLRPAELAGPRPIRAGLGPYPPGRAVVVPMLFGVGDREDGLAHAAHALQRGMHFMGRDDAMEETQAALARHPAGRILISEIAQATSFASRRRSGIFERSHTSCRTLTGPMLCRNRQRPISKAAWSRRLGAIWCD